MGKKIDVTAPVPGGEIEALTPLEQMRLRPSMYIGETESPEHLWLEAIDNACDECMCEFSNKIEVYKEDGWYVTRDWGRGIPLTSTKMPGKDVPVELATQIFSGGKFTSGLYNFSSGLHGVGITIITALSDNVTISTIYDSDHHVVYYFEDAQFIKKEIVPLLGDFATELRFKPSQRFFTNINCDEKIIKERLSIVKYGLGENVKIIFNNEELKGSILDNFKKDTTSIISGSYKNKQGETCEIMVGLTDPDNGRSFTGVVNLLNTNDGTHMRSSLGRIKEKLFDMSQKKKMHLGTPEDILSPVKVMCTMMIKNPAFVGQTKGKLATKREFIDNLIDNAVDNLLRNNSEFIDKWLELSEQYRIELDNKKKEKKRRVGRTVTAEGLRDCHSNDPSKNSIFLLEGKSAEATFISCRDNKFHALLALRGKVLNVSDATKSKIMENSVIESICTALGYKPFQEIDPAKCRYNNVMIVADADPDGKHITALLVTFFYTIMPELIKAGKVYVIETPLYGTRINKKFVPIFDESKVDEYRNKKYDISRFKGLGEMDPDELYYSAIDPTTRRIKKLIFEEINMDDLWESLGKFDVTEARII